MTQKKKEASKAKGLKKSAVSIGRLSAALARDIRGETLKTHAAGLAYTTLVTIVPFLAISFAVLKGLGMHNQMEPFIISLLDPLGDQGREIAEKIVSFVDNIKVGVLGSVGLAILVYGVMNMMRKIEAAFNVIWRVKRERTALQRFRDYLGALFIGPFLISLSVAMAEVFSSTSLFATKFGFDFSTALPVSVTGIVPYALFTIAFAALYVFMPNTHVRIIPALIAGSVTAALWKVMGKVFSVFVVGAGSYAAIYSAFAALMLLMIWIYLGWLIVLIGAAMAYYLQNPTSQKMIRNGRALSARVREKAALLICGEIGRAFYAGEPPPSLQALSAATDLPSVITADTVEMLTASGLLVVTGKAFSAGYIPGRPFDETTVADMLKKLRSVEEQEGISFPSLQPAKAADALLEAATAAADREWAKKTLKQLAE